jgi:glycosyltransferase involved in cell wall biosynthesis
MPPRVLFVTTTYPLTPGDAVPGFVADLARSLVEHQGVRVTVLAPHHPGASKSETVDGVRIERFQYTHNPSHQCLAYGNGIPDNLKNLPRAKSQIPGLLAAMAAAVHRHLDRTDIIHAHWVEPAFIASIANFFHRKPLVISVHSLKPAASRLNRHTLASADRVLFNSAYTMNQAAEKGYRCLGSVVHPGYDDRLFGATPRDGAMRRELGIPSDAIVIAAVGRMIEVKGLHILAAAAEMILASHPSVHIILAGDGPERARVESIVANLPSSGRIHFPGALPRQRVARLLAESDLFVNPGVVDRTGRAEGFGITTIEAMASGLAVLGSRVGGITETIADGVSGLLVPPGDPRALAAAVGDLLDDAPRRARMGQAGQQIAANRFRWPVLAGRVAEFYGELYDARNAAGSS